MEAHSSPIAAELVQRALDKFKANNGQFAAILVGESGSPGLDGVQWKFVVTDGSQVDAIDAELSGSEGGRQGMDVDAGSLEAAVEHRALTSFPIHTRFDDLLEASPLQLRREDL